MCGTSNIQPHLDGQKTQFNIDSTLACEIICGLNYTILNHSRRNNNNTIYDRVILQAV